LVTSLRLRMRKLGAVLLSVVLCGFVLTLTGCGGGTPEDGTDNSNNSGGGTTNNPPPPPPSGDLAPTSIGNNTIHGTFVNPHDNTSLVHFHITTVGDTSGTYTYEEENLPTNTGNYTWTKTGPDTAFISTSNNGQLSFTYTTPQSGTYEYQRPGYDEKGTFTTDH